MWQSFMKTVVTILKKQPKKRKAVSIIAMSKGKRYYAVNHQLKHPDAASIHYNFSPSQQTPLKN